MRTSRSNPHPPSFDSSPEPGARSTGYAPFHKAKKLEIPENVVLLFQPAYSPDINPIERVWQYVKKQESWLNFETLADLQKNVCQQLNELCRETIASLTGYPFILSALGKLNL